MTETYHQLLEKVHELTDLRATAGVMGWDRETNMPKAGDPARIQQMTTLRRLIHERATSPELGALIDAAAAELAGAEPDSDEAALIRVLRYDYDRATKLPKAFVVRMATTSAQARAVWEQARQDDDFASFRPWLEQLVDIQRELAELYGYTDEPYDALLESYELGARTAGVRATFDAVRAATVPLVAAIRERGRPIDDRLLHQSYDVAEQQAFARYIAEAVGYDLSRGHLGTVVHPFATSFSRDDVRITTRWYPDFLSPSLFGTLHESGHAIYEQGTHPDLARTPLARGTSSGIHESQSRMVENVVGRSRGFWQTHFPVLQRQFRAQLGERSVDDFYRAINKVQSSLIRVEADELTYNLHIVLRFELEQAMLGGDLTVADLPQAWNERLTTLLGVTPPNDREGVLQDVHWSGPSFGYFPTYALGNLYAAQFFEAACARDPAVEADLARGSMAALLAWLREHVHQYGRKFPPDEIVRRATGRPLDHAPFVRYVTAKFGALYGV